MAAAHVRLAVDDDPDFDDSDLYDEARPEATDGAVSTPVPAEKLPMNDGALLGDASLPVTGGEPVGHQPSAISQENSGRSGPGEPGEVPVDHQPSVTPQENSSRSEPQEPGGEPDVHQPSMNPHENPSQPRFQEPSGQEDTYTVSQTKPQTVSDAALPTSSAPQTKTEDAVMQDAHLSDSTTAINSDETMHDTDGAVIKTEPVTADALAFDSDFIDAARANRDDPDAEFAEDSDPEVSDSETLSSDDSEDSDSDDDSEGGSVMLDAAEAARILMRASPDEGGQSAKSAPRTQHEAAETPYNIPDIKNLEDLKIVELGRVSHIIASTNCVVVKAKKHNEHNVLEPESALCLADRTLIRPISDTIAQVYEPFYVVYFQSEDEIKGFGIEEGTQIFYIDHIDHRRYVFYESLKQQKFSDASNFYDEEAQDNEVEFSDDEKEAEWKRLQKQKKNQRRYDENVSEAGSVTADPGRGRGGRGRGRRGRYDAGSRRGARRPHFDREESVGGGGMGSLGGYASHGSLDYDAPVAPNADEDGPYRVLQRPDNYGSAASYQPGVAPPIQASSPPFASGGIRGNDVPRFGRGRGRGRGRGYGASAAPHPLHPPPQQYGYNTMAPPQAVYQPAQMGGNGFVPPSPGASGNFSFGFSAPHAPVQNISMPAQPANPATMDPAGFQQWLHHQMAGNASNNQQNGTFGQGGPYRGGP